MGVILAIKGVALMSEGVGILRGCWCQCWHQCGSLNNLKKKVLVSVLAKNLLMPLPLS